jgi:integrase
MAKPTELADLTAELKERIPFSRFRFEWSSEIQGKHLILCGDWNRCGKRSSRTLYGSNGAAMKRQKRPLSTDSRQEALEAATKLVNTWCQGGDTRQRCKCAVEPAGRLLATQRRVVVDGIRSRSGGHGVKQKHLRHARALFEWLDVRNQPLDAPSSIRWAGEGVQQDTDTYSDRLRLAQWACQWACQWNRLYWFLPKSKRPIKPVVTRPFVDGGTDADLEVAFNLIHDKHAAAFFRVVAATGCRPSEVSLFDWAGWQVKGRPQALSGYSPKVEKEFVAICNPQAWIQGIDPSLLTVDGVDPKQRPVTAQTRELLVRHYSRLLKLVKKDLKAAGWMSMPTWTDLRHMWTIRAELDGFDMRIAAISQAHSHKMAELVYLRHGEQKQVLAEIERYSRLHSVAA